MRTRALVALALLALLQALPAIHVDASAQAQVYEPCTLSALGEVVAYENPEKTKVAATLLPGDGGQVMGQLKDGTYSIALGLYYVEAIPLGAMSWVDYSADIALKGECGSLPLIALTCTMGFSAPTSAYAQPDDSRPVMVTFDSTDTARDVEVVGQLSNGWYATPDPAAPANRVGTLGLLWVKAAPTMGISCRELPTFYPIPKLPGEICTVRTSAQGENHLIPDDAVTTGITPLPTSTVQILAAASADWYGYDPATEEDGALGVSRLRWIKISQTGVEIKGDCTHIPVIATTPKALTTSDNHTQVTARVGETITITVPTDIRPGAGWAQTPSSGPINDAAVLAQQGQPDYIGPAGGFGTELFTFQAVSAGTTTIDLGYTSEYGQPDQVFDHRFMIEVTVEPAWILGG